MEVMANPGPWKKNEQILFGENSSGCRWRRGLGAEGWEITWENIEWAQAE